MNRPLTIEDILYELKLRTESLEEMIDDEPYQPYKIPYKVRKREIESLISWIEIKQQTGL